MANSKRVLLAAGACLVIGLSTLAIAQTQSKSKPVANLAEGEVIMVNPKSGAIHKSNTSVPTARHQAALAKGAKEISNNTVIYRQGGKMYMFDYQDAANTQAAENFQEQFDND